MELKPRCVFAIIGFNSFVDIAARLNTSPYVTSYLSGWDLPELYIENGLKLYYDLADDGWHFNLQTAAYLLLVFWVDENSRVPWEAGMHITNGLWSNNPNPVKILLVLGEK